MTSTHIPMKAKFWLLLLIASCLAAPVPAQTEPEAATPEIILVHLRKNDTIVPDFRDSLVEFRTYDTWLARRGELAEVTETALTIHLRKKTVQVPIRELKSIVPLHRKVWKAMRIVSIVVYGLLAGLALFYFIVGTLLRSTSFAVGVARASEPIAFSTYIAEIALLTTALVLSLKRGRYFDLRRKWKMVVRWKE